MSDLVPVTEPIEGLEDTDDSDRALPIIRIDHKEGVFVDSLTGETFESFECVALGRIKQRILWKPDGGTKGEGPMCRSRDFATGEPNAGEWLVNFGRTTAQKTSGFSLDEVESGALPCVECKLKEWDTHPTKEGPWCNEQHVFPVARFLEDGGRTLGIVTFSKSGLQSARRYVSGFIAAKKPLYTAITKISAIHQKRGTVEFVVPAFERVRDADPSEFPEYSETYQRIREYLTTSPAPRGATEPTPGRSEPVEATIHPEPVPSDPAPVKRATPVVPDDEEPF